MSASGTDGRIAPAGVALAAVIAGILGMPLGALAGQSLGLQGALVGGELALALPSLLALVALRPRLAPGALAVGPLGPVAAVWALGSGLALWLASLGLVGLQQLFWPPPEGYLEAFAKLHETLAPESPPAAAIALLAIAVTPAICEELVFRGVAQPGLRPLLGPHGALVASALLFGLIHVDLAPGGLTAWRVPFAFGVGLGLGALRERRGRLLPCIAAHAALNALTWSLVALLGAEPEATGPAPLPSLAALLAGVVTLTLIVRRNWPGDAPALRLG